GWNEQELPRRAAGWRVQARVQQSVVLRSAGGIHPGSAEHRRVPAEFRIGADRAALDARGNQGGISGAIQQRAASEFPYDRSGADERDTGDVLNSSSFAALRMTDD